MERDGCDQLEVLEADPLAVPPESSAWIGQAQPRRKMRAADAIFFDQVFILQEQALIHQASYVRQKPHPLVLSGIDDKR
ncbi:MAG TPA: hypothetical protein VN442_24125 [Bryobacteraceae bacterium]|nr:hypothetical protein [Bryobacteraceae bacterium]